MVKGGELGGTCQLPRAANIRHLESELFPVREGLPLGGAGRERVSAEDLATSPHVWPWRSERSRKARARAARTYLNRPLLHNATNEGAEVGRRKGENDDAKYRAQKHAADQALLVVLISHTCGSCTSWRAKQGPTAQRLSELTSKAHTKIGKGFLVGKAILSAPARRVHERPAGGQRNMVAHVHLHRVPACITHWRCTEWHIPHSQ